jgi:hypothetical protein
MPTNLSMNVASVLSQVYIKVGMSVIKINFDIFSITILV